MGWHRWLPHTPSRAEIADQRAMLPGPAFGEILQPYLPTGASSPDSPRDPSLRLEWLWCCPTCWLSETGINTREAARGAFEKHRDRCPGKEPDWLRAARTRYRDELEEKRRRAPGGSIYAAEARTRARALDNRALLEEQEGV